MMTCLYIIPIMSVRKILVCALAPLSNSFGPPGFFHDNIEAIYSDKLPLKYDLSKLVE